jgi:hypothetical protein
MRAPQVPILSQMNPIHTHAISLRYTFKPTSDLRLGITSGLFHSTFPTKTLRTSLPCMLHALLHLSLLVLISLITFDEKQKLYEYRIGSEIW